MKYLVKPQDEINTVHLNLTRWYGGEEKENDEGGVSGFRSTKSPY